MPTIIEIPKVAKKEPKPVKPPVLIWINSHGRVTLTSAFVENCEKHPIFDPKNGHYVKIGYNTDNNHLYIGLFPASQLDDTLRFWNPKTRIFSLGKRVMDNREIKCQLTGKGYKEKDIEFWPNSDFAPITFSIKL